MLASIAAPLCARMLCICKTGRNETWHVVADVFLKNPIHWLKHKAATLPFHVETQGELDNDIRNNLCSSQ